jgi:hypothetical protein
VLSDPPLLASAVLFYSAPSRYDRGVWSIEEVNARMPTLELTDEQVIALIEQLPEDQKRRVVTKLSHPDQPRKRRKFGRAKHDIIYMAPDFDAPLEDFKDYM